MRRLLSLLAFVALPLLAEQWPVSDPILRAAPGRRFHPRIAAAATTFLAAWTDTRFSRDVWGTRFDANGHVLGSVHVAANADLLAIASDGDGYLAVVAPDDCSGIDAVHIGGDGSVGPTSHIADSLDCPLVATVASNGSSYLVVYRASDDVRTRYAIYDRSGKRTRGPLPIDLGGRGPFVAASNGRDYLLLSSTGSGLVGYSITANGDVGPPRTIDTVPVSDVAVAWNGQTYLLLITGYPLRTRFLAADGTPTGPAHQTFPPQNYNARLTWTGSEYLASWTTFVMPFATTLVVSRIGADGAILDAHASAVRPQESNDPLDFASSHGVTTMVRTSADQIYASTLSAADVDAGLVPAGALISLSAALQSRPRMAAIPGGAVITWLEDGHLYARLLDGSGKPFGAIVEVGFANSSEHHVVFDGTRIVVAALVSRNLVVQRYSTSLQLLDPQPINMGYNGRDDFALAAAGGVAFFAWTNQEVAAALLEADQPIPSRALAADSDSYPPAAAWDGSAFVVAYSTGTALAAVRVSRDGTRLDGPTLIARIPSPAVRSAITPARGGVFGAWSNFGFNARIFGAQSDLAGTAAPAPLSPSGVAEGPLLADDVVAWTLRVDGGLQLQWRGVHDDAIAALPAQPRLAALQPSIVMIGSALVAATTQFDEAAGGVPRVYVHPAPPPRRRAIGR